MYRSFPIRDWNDLLVKYFEKLTFIHSSRIWCNLALGIEKGLLFISMSIPKYVTFLVGGEFGYIQGKAEFVQ